MGRVVMWVKKLQQVLYSHLRALAIEVAVAGYSIRLLLRGLLHASFLEALGTLTVLRLAAGLDEILAACEALGRPAGRVPWLAVRVAVHHVDALEREVRGLIEEEVDDDRAGEVARGEDEAVAVADRLGDEGREEREEEVPRPVARRRERRLARTYACRERLADQDPDAAVWSARW